MLVLNRKEGESVVIDDDIKVVVLKVKGRQVKIGIEAPRDTKIAREEISHKKDPAPMNAEVVNLFKK
jgi:carbon storage regulator